MYSWYSCKQLSINSCPYQFGKETLNTEKKAVMKHAGLCCEEVAAHCVWDGRAAASGEGRGVSELARGPHVLRLQRGQAVADQIRRDVVEGKRRGAEPGGVRDGDADPASERV